LTLRRQPVFDLYFVRKFVGGFDSRRRPGVRRRGSSPDKNQRDDRERQLSKTRDADPPVSLCQEFGRGFRRRFRRRRKFHFRGGQLDLEAGRRRLLTPFLLDQYAVSFRKRCAESNPHTDFTSALNHRKRQNAVEGLRLHINSHFLLYMLTANRT